MILTPPTPQALIADTVKLIPMDADSIMAATIEANYTSADLILAGLLGAVIGIIILISICIPLVIKCANNCSSPRKKGKKK